MHNYISGTDNICFKLKLLVSQKFMVKSLLLVANKFYSVKISELKIAPLCALTSQSKSALLTL